MSSAVFRGKESSKRIEWCWLVQDLLNFGDLGSLWLLGGWGWLYGSGVGEGTPIHVHMHVHACMYTHACVVNMIISCKWQPKLGESLGIAYDVIHVCMHMHVHVCVKVMFSQVYIRQQGVSVWGSLSRGSLSGGLYPWVYLSSRISVQGVSVQRGCGSMGGVRSIH